MGVVSIARKTFVDRAMGTGELQALAVMLRGWYLLQAPGQEDTGQVRCEAHLYAFARQRREELANTLQSRLPGATLERTEPDELRVIGQATKAGDRPDISVWSQGLKEALQINACVRLRVTISGPVEVRSGRHEPMTTTFVLCGAPTEEGLLLKALWQFGRDESLALVYRSTKWHLEQDFLAAFAVYLNAVDREPWGAALRMAQSRLGIPGKDLFISERRDAKEMRWLRFNFELPDDRGPRGFVRRAGLPLGLGLLAGVAAIACRQIPAVKESLIFAAVFCGIWCGLVVRHKIIRMQRYRQAMRKGLGKLYAQPITVESIDMSKNDTPTLQKYTEEIEAEGGRKICDLRLHTGEKAGAGGLRHFSRGDTSIVVGMLRQTDNLFLFPAQPVVLMSTRFVNGQRHATTSSPIYRKCARPGWTGRCMLDGDGFEEMWILHRKVVDRMIASGALPIPPATSSKEVAERLVREHKESCEIWKRSPYGWGDALHEAFKVCRREYLED